MVRSKDTFVPLAIPHPPFETNHMEVSKVQLESWHVVVAKLHDLPHGQLLIEPLLFVRLWLWIMRKEWFS
jgi:hypothetical protein